VTGKLKEITMHDQMMGVWGWVGYTAMVLFFSIGAIAVMLWVKAWLEKGRPTGREIESALEILKTRYARGEIRKEEFEEKWKDILSVQDSRFTDKRH
jgi:uncharacterized membrane protein